MSKEIEPGFFLKDLNMHSVNNEVGKELGPETRPDLAAQLEAFKKQIRPDSKFIYYPCSGIDVTISTVFPDARVVYVDIDEEAVRKLKENKFEAVVADATKFEPDEKPSIMLLLNPAISVGKAASVLKSGGYLLANNYHDTANELKGNPEFELVAVSKLPTQEQAVVLDTERLEDYFIAIDTDEELKKVEIDWNSSLNYEACVDIITELGGESVLAKVESGESSVIAEYKKLLETYEDMKIPGTGEIVLSTDDGQTIFMESDLPTKKGIADDLFIFKKK